MSEELKKLEDRATMKYITDHEHIDKIIRYMLSLSFSYFVQDKCTCSSCVFLRLDLGFGYGIFRKMEILDSLSLEEILMMIGYAPGNSNFNPPDCEKRCFDKKFNAARHSYGIARLLGILSKKNIRIKEFMQIELSAYTDYLKKKVEDEYRNNLIPSSTCSDILREVETFKRETYLYVNADSEDNCIDEGQKVTLGDLISMALEQCEKGWNCHMVPLDQFCNEIFEGYARLNSLFMDAIRMPLVRVGRERFEEIIFSNMASDIPPICIDYDACYEPGGIKQ